MARVIGMPVPHAQGLRSPEDGGGASVCPVCTCGASVFMVFQVSIERAFKDDVQPPPHPTPTKCFEGHVLTVPEGERAQGRICDLCGHPVIHRICEECDADFCERCLRWCGGDHLDKLPPWVHVEHSFKLQRLKQPDAERKVAMSCCPSQNGQLHAVQLPHTVVHRDTVQCSALQCRSVQYSTVQYSTVQCSTVQCSTAQYSTV